MKNLIDTASEIELLKSQIEAEEFKYKTAITRHKSYVILKRIKSKIRDLKNNLFVLTGEQ